MRAALYLRVSTDRQDCANQQPELHAYIASRGWTLVREYIDAGVSGSRASRPGLDEMRHDARRRRFDVVIAWKLDRVGRSLPHLIVVLEELAACGVQFVSLGEAIDSGTAAGRLQFHLLAAFAQFERDRIGERVRAAHARLRAAGKHIGRPKHQVSDTDVQLTAKLTVRAAAAALNVSPALVCRLRRSQRPPPADPEEQPENRGPSTVAVDGQKDVTLETGARTDG